MLLALSRIGPRQMNRLSEHMLVATANVTGLINRMEKKGYVRKGRDQKDGRLFVIETTESGSRIIKSISSRFRQYAGRMVSDPTPAEFAFTLRALEKVRRRVEAGSEI